MGVEKKRGVKTGWLTRLGLLAALALVVKLSHNGSLALVKGTNEESIADEISKKIKLEDLLDLLKDTRFAFFTLDSPQDEPIIVSDKSENEKTKKDKDTHATSHNIPEDTSVPHPPSPKSAQIQELMAQVHLLQSQKENLEQQKAKAEEEVASLKARPSYPDINQLTKLLLKQHVRDMEIKLPEDLKEIPTKQETFTSTISSLTSQVTELKNIQWELPTKFATMMENASGANTKDVPSAGQATASPAEEEKNTNPAITDVEPNLHDELVDLLGIDVVTQYYNKKLLYDKYYDKMEDGTNEVISNVKVNDLHLAEWSKVVQACPGRNEKGWKAVYGLIKTIMEYLDQTKKELKIDFNKPLKEQDPLNELNDLANKKRKRTGDSTDHSRSTKKHKSSVQHEEEFESLKFLQRQLFRSLEDWEVSSLQFMQRYRN
ncbi:hypothetical protein Tco_0400030 [Tanacetum coccineum]